MSKPSDLALMIEDCIDTNKLMSARLKIKFDVRMLDNIIGFLYKDSTLRSRKVLTSIQKLFDAVDEQVYEKDTPLYDRIWVIQNTLRLRLKEGYENDNMIIMSIEEELDFDINKQNIIDQIPTLSLISYDESKSLIKLIDDRLRYGYSLTIKQVIQELFDEIDSDDYRTYKSISEDMYKVCSAMVNIKRTFTSDTEEGDFSLLDDDFNNSLDSAVKRLKDRNKIFVTGLKRLNVLLSPGYLSGRVYCYMALPGGGKSRTLLNTAIQIKNFNRNIKPKNSKKIPTVLYLTLENSVDETIERLFNTTVCDDDIRNYTTAQIKKKLKKDGEMVLTDDNNINILIRYRDNRAVDANDMYDMIQDLDDQGLEVIALIVDYIKRIRPIERARDEKGEMKNISNELKSLARHCDIPVITAHQLNRAAASTIDAAMQSNKEDLTKLIGRDGISVAWEILENVDWMCIINDEFQASTGKLYQVYKLLKRRYRSTEDDLKLRRLDYFCQPYEDGSEIRLVNDIYMKEPASVLSLASNFESASESKRGKKNAVERKSENPTDIDGYEPFEFGKLVT